MSVAGTAVLVAVLAAATAYALVRRRRSGALRTPDEPAAAPLSAADLGRPLGERATLVQFSSAFCRPCVATRQVLGRAAADLPGVAHVEVDAESHLALVRRLGVASTPTTLVLDRAGVERRRATGVPRRDDVVAAVAAVSD
jgi:thiol-disulfide isomerase/thioredoxin